MNNFNFFELEETPSMHIGRRIIKTVIAVFACALIGYLRGNDSTILSMVAAIICIQPTKDESLMNALNRMIGTVIGGLMGAGCSYLGRVTGLINYTLIYHLVIAIMIIPIIQLTLMLRKPSISSFTSIVFLIVTLSLGDNVSPVLYSLERTLETLIGIGVGLGVNYAFPRSKKEREAEKAKEKAEAEKREIEAGAPQSPAIEPEPPENEDGEPAEEQSRAKE